MLYHGCDAYQDAQAVSKNFVHYKSGEKRPETWHLYALI